MKIAVYSIAKNEAQFVERWYESAKDADYILICDTGSTDSTVADAEALGINVTHIKVDPWRFDVARNASLDAIPDDIDLCIALDMDEVLVKGWRAHAEEAWRQGFTRPRYSYTWSWNEDGTPGLVYGGDKIHARAGARWKHPVHEVLDLPGEIQGWCGLEILHFPDTSKSRSQYLPLLELAVQEDQEDDRNAHYLAREYFFSGNYEKAAAEFVRHLNLPRAVWVPERAASMRYLFKITGDQSFLDAAIVECPDRREAWVELAQLEHDRHQWWACLDASINALKIKSRPLEYLTEAFAWGALPHDLAAIAAFNLGLFAEAEYQGGEALKFSPTDTRLIDNMRFYTEAAHGNDA